mmetsp:Transcript_17430/g.55720  ORF Transcript_17430/g.55720 Transcript_17430/m.55720 type:complete len:140 (-) Transcript_17430:420-839(-)
MRTVGCGWTQFETKWGFFSDERSHKIVDLQRMLLDDILPYEIQLRRLKKLPTEATPPQLRVRSIKTLGTADADVLRLEQQSLFNVANLLEKAKAARERREAEGISDTQRRGAAGASRPPLRHAPRGQVARGVLAVQGGR